MVQAEFPQVLLGAARLAPEPELDDPGVPGGQGEGRDGESHKRVEQHGELHRED